MDEATLYKKWQSHCCNCRNKKVKWLTRDQYRMAVIQAGIEPSQIGNGRGCYQLSRYTDKGDYTPDSCRFLTMEENQREMVKNGGRAAAAAKKRGRTAETHPGLARMAATKAKPFSLLSPDGEIHTGVNLYAFCKARGLNQGNMVEVNNGKSRICKGWTKAPRAD